MLKARLAIEGANVSNASRRPAAAARSRSRKASETMLGLVSLLLASSMVACGGSDEVLAPPSPDPPLPVRTIYYVSLSGDDLSPGTREAPYRSIQRAVDGAVGLTDIRVAEGLYSEAVRLKRDVSIYGGYKSADWDSRDPKSYVSRISAGSRGAASVTIPTGVTATTVLDGLTVVGTNFIAMSNAVAVHPGASPVISGNTLTSGTAMGGIGLSLEGSAATVANNVIHVGLVNSMGIFLSGVSADRMLNNTINVAAFGVGGTAFGVNISSSSASGLEVSNNIIVVSGGLLRFGIRTDLQSGVIVQNNDIFVSNDSGGAFVGSAGNIAVDPGLVDSRLVTTSPAAVRLGGISLAGYAYFPRNADAAPVDIDHKVRTEPWSIGANEVND